MRSDYRLAVLWDGETVGYITPARNGGLNFSYAQSWLTEIDKVFGHTNTIVMVYDEEDGEQAGALADSLDDDPKVRSAVCYESTLGKQRLVADMHDFIDDMQGESDSSNLGSSGSGSSSSDMELSLRGPLF